MAAETADLTMLGPDPAVSFGAGRYTTRRLLGEGGQKTVYLVHDEALDRDCALALIHGRDLEAETVARAIREAQVMARLTHPNIVTVHDIGDEAGVPFIVSEYVAGADLRRELRAAAGAPLPLGRALAIAKDVCRALAVAHKRGVIHRDVKPDNVWLAEDGTAKLGDFGIALPLARSRLTASGAVMGTPAYMAPEQAQGLAIDERSDLYALGCLLYELVTGLPPFVGEDALAVISQHVHVPPPPPTQHNPAVPRPLERLLLQLLAKPKDQRPTAAEDVLRALEELVVEEPAASAPRPAAAAPPLAEHLYRLARAPFVARGRELGALKSALEGGLAGRGGIVLLSGEPGVGKTRLAQELALYAQLRGAKVLVGRCPEGQGTPPYFPFVEALDAALAEHRTEDLRRRLGEDALVVAKLLPQIAARLRDLPPPPQLPPESERYLLFQAVTALLREIAQPAGLVLVLEDLHWADEPSLQLLQHLARQLEPARLLVVGIYREAEVAARHPLALVLDDLRRDRLFERIALRGLVEDEVRALLTVIGEREPPDAFVRALYRQTEGNPFFIEEILRALVQEGIIYRSDGGWAADRSIPEMLLPEGVKQAIGRRLSRLSYGCHSLLRQAAILGREFGHAVLAQLVGLPEEEVLDLVDEALRALVLEEIRGRETTYSFKHALTRQTLLETLSHARFQRLHLRAAAAIEAAAGGAPEQHAAEIAHHLLQAGTGADPQKLVRYLALAGKQAQYAGAFDDAIRHYDAALALEPTEGRADLLFKRGLARRSLGRWEDALADWREALALYEQTDDVDVVGHVYGIMAQQLLWGARYVEALDITQRGLARLGRRVTADRGLLLAGSGMTLSLAGLYEAAEHLLGEALRVAEELGDRHLLGQVMAHQAAHHLSYGQIPKLAEAGLRGAELLRSLGDLWNLGDTLCLTSIGLIALGRLAEVERIGEELEPLASRLGHRATLAVAYRHRAYRGLMQTGDLDAFEDFARRDLELCRSAGMPEVSQSYGFLGLAHFWKGDWTTARENFEQAVRLEPPGIFTGLEWPNLFLVHAHAGEKDAALALLQQRRRGTPMALGMRGWLALRVMKAARFSGVSPRMFSRTLSMMRSARMEQYLPRAGRVNTLGSWHMQIGVTLGLYLLGARKEAGRFYPVTAHGLVATGTLIDFYSRIVQTVAAMAAAGAGLWERAEEHFALAVRQADELPHRIEQAEVRRWYALALLDRDAPGDREKARRLLEEAIAGYRRLGMPRHEEMAGVLLARA